MKNILKNIIVLFLILVGVVFLFPQRIILNDSAIAPQTKAVSLSIEKLNIEAPIKDVGVLDNAMDVPDDPVTVGWYQYGTRPGQPGSSVLAGHVSWKGGQPAVFANLDQLSAGDIVTVSYEDETQDSFVVRDLKRYPLDNKTEEVFISSDGGSYLNLITCDGAWSNTLGTHELRLVVFTEKI